MERSQRTSPWLGTDYEFISFLWKAKLVRDSLLESHPCLTLMTSYCACSPSWTPSVRAIESGISRARLASPIELHHKARMKIVWLSSKLLHQTDWRLKATSDTPQKGKRKKTRGKEKPYFRSVCGMFNITAIFFFPFLLPLSSFSRKSSFVRRRDGLVRRNVTYNTVEMGKEKRRRDGEDERTRWGGEREREKK